MLYGIGCDLCDISRMQVKLQGAHGRHLAERLFAPTELALLQLDTEDAFREINARTAERAAANFAAKEALLKAGGMGIGGLSLTDIAVLRLESGAPYYSLQNGAKAWAEQLGVKPFLTLSHESGLALAFCALEKQEQ